MTDPNAITLLRQELQQQCQRFLQEQTNDLQQAFPQFELEFWSSDEVDDQVISCYLPGNPNVDSLILAVELSERNAAPMLVQAEICWEERVLGMNITLATEMSLNDQPLLDAEGCLKPLAVELQPLIDAFRNALHRGDVHTAAEKKEIAQTLKTVDATLAAAGFDRRLANGRFSWRSTPYAREIWHTTNNPSRALGFAGVYVRQPTGARNLDYYFLIPPENGHTIIIPFPADASQPLNERMAEFIAQIKRDILPLFSATT